MPHLGFSSFAGRASKRELRRVEGLINVYRDRKFSARKGIPLNIREEIDTAHEKAVSLIDKVFEGLKRMLVIEESPSQDSSRGVES